MRHQHHCAVLAAAVVVVIAALLVGTAAAQLATPASSPTSAASSSSPPSASAATFPDPALQFVGDVEFGARCDWKLGGDDCPDGFQCVPIPSNVSAGICASEPPGGLPLPLGLAKPVFLFPLINGSLDSWPWGSRTARPMLGTEEAPTSATQFTDMTDDTDLIPGALICRGQGYRLQIDNFQYGRAGPFAINIWAKVLPSLPPSSSLPSDALGSVLPLFGYLVSQSSVGVSPVTQPWAPNQVQMFIHAPGRPLSGVVRALLKDGNDGPGVVFLDSDGTVGDTSRSSPGPFLVSNMTDGNWHMVTLTTRPDDSRGYMLYVDGALAAQLPVPSGGATEVDGGDASSFTGPLVVCGRSDGDSSRGFRGAVANLAVFDMALSASEVKALYQSVTQGPSMTGSAVGVVSGTQGGLRQVVTAPTLYDTTGLFWPRVPPSLQLPDGTAAAATPSTPGPGSLSGSSPPGTSGPTGTPGTSGLVTGPTSVWQTAVLGRSEGQSCSLDLGLTTDTMEFCDSGLVCVPHRTWLANGVRQSPHYPDGVCAEPEVGTLMPERYPPAFPTPLAYFPLSDTDKKDSILSSWPDGAYNGVAQNTQSIVDSRFGYALMCNKSQVTLDTIPYGATGGFAVNLWMRTSTQNLNGSLFSYLFSHTAKNVTNFQTDPSQVHLLVPQTLHPLYGLSGRVLLRDSQDTNTGRPSQVWLDSNGMVGNDVFADIPEDGVHIDDGEWHMLTITTLPGPEDMPWSNTNSSSSFSSSGLRRPAGFSLYVDGVLRGTLSSTSMRTTIASNDTQVQVTGGAPALMDGPITLCGRVDQDPGRSFTGALSNLMLFDVALTPAQVAELYTSYKRQAVWYPLADVASDGQTANQTATNGKQCVFPFSLGGRLFYNCVYMDGVLSCPTTDNGAWAPCQNPDSSSIPDDDLDLSEYQVSDGTQIWGSGLLRTTTSGQVCVIPFTYNNNSYADCVNVNGTQMCAVPGGRLQECAPIIKRPLNSSAACTAPAASTPNSLANKIYTTCVSILGTTQCRTQAGTWLLCAPPNLGRVTLTGSRCQLPFTYDGWTRNDCILDPFTSSDREVCPISSSIPSITGAGSGPTSGAQLSDMAQCQTVFSAPAVLQPRTPTRWTMDGQRCVAPGPGAMSECLDYARVGNNSWQCQTAVGALFECAPTRRNGSITGAPCAFPFVFRGYNRTDCVWVDGVEACRTAAGDWQECKSTAQTLLPLAPQDSVARYTTHGFPCVFPFSFQGQVQWDCVGARPGAGDPGYCRIVDGTWHQCAPNTTAQVARLTSTGEPCVLPFRNQQNVTYNDCMLIDPITGSAGQCLTRNGRFASCAPRTRNGALSGQQCVFPSVWRGRNVTECVIGPLQSGEPACKTNAPNATQTGGWEPCDVLFAVDAPDDTSSGVQGSGLSPEDLPAVAAARKQESAEDNEDKKKKTLALVLGLVFGLGGGLVLLVSAFLVGRNIWQRKHRAQVMRDMGLSGPSAQQALAASSSFLPVVGAGWPEKPLPPTASPTGGTSTTPGKSRGAASITPLTLPYTPTTSGKQAPQASSSGAAAWAQDSASGFTPTTPSTTGSRLSTADRIQQFKLALGQGPVSPALTGRSAYESARSDTGSQSLGARTAPAATPTGATAMSAQTPAAQATGATTAPSAGATGAAAATGTGADMPRSPFQALSNELAGRTGAPVAPAATGQTSPTPGGSEGAATTTGGGGGGGSPGELEMMHSARSNMPLIGTAVTATSVPSRQSTAQLTPQDSVASTTGMSPRPRRPAPPPPPAAAGATGGGAQ